MKLLLCKNCQDIVRPLIGKERSCECGSCTVIGSHDNVTIIYSGEKAVILGIKNSSLKNAVARRPDYGQGEDFVAFVIPKNCSSVIKKQNL